MRSLEFHPEAQAELIGAGQSFEREAENLGIDFMDFVQRRRFALCGFLRAAVVLAVASGELSCRASSSCFCIAWSVTASSYLLSRMLVVEPAIGDPVMIAALANPLEVDGRTSGSSRPSAGGRGPLKRRSLGARDRR